MIKYFVSFTFTSNGERAFGNSSVDLPSEIKTEQDIVAASDMITVLIKSVAKSQNPDRENLGVVILNYQEIG